MTVHESTRPAAPLLRNRNYQLLWSSQALSLFGMNASTIAFPLVTLVLTHSPADSGVVLGVAAAAGLIVGVPGGALVDRWNRKKIMLYCEAIQAVAAGSLVLTLWWNVATVAQLAVVAAIMGGSEALFRPAENACLPAIVPTDQLPGAVAMNAARAYLGNLGGTASGGFLFALGRFVPFAADLITHGLACIGLAFVRIPARTVAPQPIHQLGREMAEGLRWVWGQPHIRTTTLCAAVLNLFFSAFYVVVIVVAQLRGMPAGEIGVMAAMLGVGGVAGSLAAPLLTKRFSPPVLVIGVFWVLAALTPLAVLIHNGYLMGLLFLVMALLPPAANTAIVTEQLILTPDELRGRLTGVLGVISGLAGAVGPVLGGAAVAAVSGGRALQLCAAGIAASALLATASRSLRHFPKHSGSTVDSGNH
ncbi:MAG TPA: MFS transporter [Pseudonocardiaceae bacterium]|jgi:MFS family permease|nr:MFS transporter [Pseudonocardiaceae bacterium]